MNNAYHRSVRTASMLALAALLVACVELRHAPRVAAQTESPPLQGGAQTMSAQQAAARLLRAPSGKIFRVWTHWVGADDHTVVLASSPDGVTWTTLISLQPEQGITNKDGQVAVDEAGNIALAYRWAKSGSRTEGIRLARSTDAGKAWTVSTDSLGSGNAFDPRLAWGRGKTLIVAWSDERRQRRVFDVYTRRSPDGGVTWESEVRMSKPLTQVDQGDDEISFGPRLVGDGNGKFWLVWVRFQGGQSTLRLARSEDDGRTWSEPQLVSGASRSVSGQSLEVSRNNQLLLTWQDQNLPAPAGRLSPSRIYATASKDGGSTWSPIVAVDRLSASAPTNAAAPTRALTPSGEAWIAWYDNRNGRNDVFVARSPDGGMTWGEPRRLDADAPGTAESRHPSLTVSADGTMVAVVWEDDRNGPEAIYGRIFSNGQWSGETRLHAPLPRQKAARAPAIVPAGKGAFYVVWEVWDYSFGAGQPRRSLEDTILRVGPAPGS